jgi:hypothetical protein
MEIYNWQENVKKNAKKIQELWRKQGACFERELIGGGSWKRATDPSVKFSELFLTKMTEIVLLLCGEQHPANWIATGMWRRPLFGPENWPGLVHSGAGQAGNLTGRPAWKGDYGGLKISTYLRFWMIARASFTLTGFTKLWGLASVNLYSQRTFPKGKVLAA